MADALIGTMRGSGALAASPFEERHGASRGGTPWHSLREPRVRWISWTLAFSALAHVAFTPFIGWLGLLGWLLAPPPPPDTEAEQLRSIPITLLSDEELAQSGAFEPPPPAATSATEVAVPEATAPRAPVTPPPKPVPAAPPAPRPEPTQATPRPPPGKDASGVGHPVAMSGVSSELVDSNANVNLLLVTERIREHPLGPRIGKLIVNFPQWSSFFASGDIDPVRDINRILVVGPQFRRTADVVAILEHDLPAPVLRGAIDQLVQRPPKGRWLRSKIPAARANADRAERVFAMTAPHVLVVAPTALEKQVLAMPPASFPNPEGDAALVLHIKTPWRALIGLPFRLPESIAWLRLEVVPLSDGGARVVIEGEDADARQAAEHAASLSLALNAVTNPDLGALGALVGLRSIAFIDKIQFQSRDKRISGQVRVTPRQLDRLMVYAEELTESWTGRGQDAPRGQPSAPLPAAPRAQPSPRRAPASRPQQP
jgi:hypothetical protein